MCAFNAVALDNINIKNYENYIPPQYFQVS